MLKDYFDIIFKTAQMSILVPLLVGIFFRFKSFNTIKYILFILLTISVIVALFSRYLWSLKENNLYLLHFYTVLEFCGWIVIYYLLFESVIMKKILFVLGISFIVFSVVNSVFLQPLSTFNSNSRSLESIILVGLSITYFFKIFKEKKVVYLERNDLFWLNSAALIYFSGSFLLFGFSNLLLQSNSYEIKEVWVIHALFLCMHYLLITIGLWIKPEQIISH